MEELMTDSTSLQKDLTSHPVTSYINSLTSKNSKRAMLSTLKTVLAVALDCCPKDLVLIVVFEFQWPTLTID